MSPDNDRERNGYEWRLRQLEKDIEEIQREGSAATKVLKERLENHIAASKDRDAMHDKRLDGLERGFSAAAKSVILVTATGAVALFVWLIQTAGTS